MIKKVRMGIRNPTRAINRFVKPAYRNTSVAVTSRIPLGTHIFDREWDMLIILDTCRVDALREVADKYEYIDEIGHILSVGGSSPEWMVQTFDKRWEETLRNTAYLTSNAWTERILDDRLKPDNEYSEFRILTRLRRFGDWNLVLPGDLGRIEKIWKYVLEDEKIKGEHDPGGLMPGGAPPRYVTDRGISVNREYNFDRIILHYMQPHAPYVATAIREGRELHRYEKEPFDYLHETGNLGDVWSAYLDELQYVLDELYLLLNNTDAETVVISADHGEAFGEYNVYNHHSGSVHPKVRIVPWVITSATDSGSYSPQIEPRVKDNVSTTKSLKALGYMN